MSLNQRPVGQRSRLPSSARSSPFLSLPFLAFALFLPRLSLVPSSPTRSLCLSLQSIPPTTHSLRPALAPFSSSLPPFPPHSPIPFAPHSPHSLLTSPFPPHSPIPFAQHALPLPRTPHPHPLSPRANQQGETRRLLRTRLNKSRILTRR